MDPTVHPNTDPDPNFQFDVDPDADPTTHFFPDLDPPMLQNDRQRLPPHFDADPDQDHALDFDADPDTPFHIDLDADPDP
jgi:hypothetical protein